MRISLLSVEFIILWTFSQSLALKDKDGKQINILQNIRLFDNL